MFWSGPPSSHFHHFSIILHCYFFPISCVLPLNVSPLSACMCTGAGPHPGAWVASWGCIPKDNSLYLPNIHTLPTALAMDGTLCHSLPHMLGFRPPLSCAWSHRHWEFMCDSIVMFRKHCCITVIHSFSEHAEQFWNFFLNISLPGTSRLLAMFSNMSLSSPSCHPQL